MGASRELGLNHATVARRLNALEDALGSRLFVRRTSGTDLSADGEKFLLHAERIESAVLAARQTTGADALVEGTVRIGAPDGFGVAFIAPRLSQLASIYPGLQIELVPVPRTFSLSRREADIAITMQRPREGRLLARKLTDYTLGLYASRSYLDEHGQPQTLQQLSSHRLVGYVDDLIFTPSLDYTGEFLRDWRSTVAVSSALGQLGAVRSGAGIGILHRFMSDEEPELVRILPQHAITRSYWTVVHEDLKNIKRVNAVSDFLIRIVNESRAMF